MKAIKKTLSAALIGVFLLSSSNASCHRRALFSRSCFEQRRLSAVSIMRRKGGRVDRHRPWKERERELASSLIEAAAAAAAASAAAQAAGDGKKGRPPLFAVVDFFPLCSIPDLGDRAACLFYERREVEIGWSSSFPRTRFPLRRCRAMRSSLASFFSPSPSIFP